MLLTGQKRKDLEFSWNSQNEKFGNGVVFADVRCHLTGDTSDSRNFPFQTFIQTT